MHTRKKVLVILNPKAGKGLNKKILTIADEILQQNVFEVTTVETEYAGHATILAGQAVQEKFDIVTCVGGDGTVNETAKALVNSNTILAVIPNGSGNGLARHLGIPINEEKAFMVINKFKTVCIDTFTINDRFAVNVSGVGFDAYVAQRFAKGKTRGFINYLRCVIQSFSLFKSFQVTSDNIELRHKHAWLISFANSSQFGNNAYVAPNADCADGFFDITISQKIPLHKVPEFSYRLFNKKLRENSFIQFARATEAQFYFSSKVPLHIDGEPAGETLQVHLKIIPASLKIIVP